MTNVYGHGPEQDPRKSKLFTSIHSNHQELIRPEKPEKKSVLPEPIISARRELRLKHSKYRRNVLIALSVIIGLILALLATDTIKLGTGPRPSFASVEAMSATTTTVQVAGEQIESIRTPTAKDPLRVYIAGDSLTGSYALDLSNNFGETGVIKPYYDYRPSSGLVNSDFFDWFKQSEKVVSQINPELVIFMIGTNDASIVSTHKNNFKEKYTELLEKLVSNYDLDETKFYFILSPAMKETKLNNNLIEINKVISDFAKENELKTISTRNLLSSNGTYSSSIKVEGKSISVRASDGVHISNEGGTLLSDHIFNSIVNYFDLDKHFLNNESKIDPVKIKGCCSSISNSSNQVTKTTTKKTSTTTSSSSPSTSEPEDSVPDSTAESTE